MTTRKILIAYVDGASRGNPGHASYGVSIRDAQGTVIAEFGEYIGKATNSVAEYSALIRALEEAKNMGAARLQVFTDSQLVARQFQGLYRVKHEAMQSLMGKVRVLEQNFESVTVDHIPRSSHPGNKRADQLANLALDRVLRPA